MSESISHVVEASDFFFMFIFVTEAILRITAVGEMMFYALHVKFVLACSDRSAMVGLGQAYPNQYIRSRWNRFDYTIIVLNIFGTCINLTKDVDIDPRVVSILILLL
jgi:predicted membrane channel-forming protein YqfA (hemolysin III family)